MSPRTSTPFVEAGAEHEGRLVGSGARQALVCDFLPYKSQPALRLEEAACRMAACGHGHNGAGWRGMLTPGELVWLLAAVARGDEAAFERLYGATRAKLYGVVLRILQRADLADDVMQDAYLRIWRGAGDFDPGIATPITWMVAIARNRALDLARIDLARRRSEASLDAEPKAFHIASDDPGPEARYEMTEALRRLLACLGDLEPEQRRLVLLAYCGGWSREQLAAKLDTPVGTVKTWLRRSLIQIRERLGS